MVNTIALSLTTAERQPSLADVVIIGGGVIGVSIAWHLASKGVRNIVVVERSEFGSGSSAKPLGGVRANFSDPANIELGQRSLDAFRRFETDFGIDIGLEQVGYLFLARTEEEASSLSESTAIQNNMGVGSRVIAPTECVELNPFLKSSVLTAGAFSSEDGYAQPSRVVEGYMQAARQLGVTFLNHTEVLGIDTGSDGVETIHTNRGQIRTEAAVCTAGAWSQRVSAMAGIEMPIEPVRRLVGLTAQRPTPNPVIPFTLDLGTTFYFHNSDNGLLFGISHQQQPGFCREFSYDWVEEMKAAARDICPSLEHEEIVEGWAGLYENTPDRNAFIGQSSEIPNFFYATGFSGHGFLQSPAVGDLVSDMYLERPSFMDPTPFSLDRLTSATSISNRELHII